MDRKFTDSELDLFTYKFVAARAVPVGYMQSIVCVQRRHVGCQEEVSRGGGGLQKVNSFMLC